jgi:hypothetical protein
MSEFPTPRLGRAVRLFTPVVLAGALAVPMLSPANEHNDKPEKAKGNVPAEQAKANEQANVIVPPEQLVADNAAQAADTAGDAGQQQDQAPVKPEVGETPAQDTAVGEPVKEEPKVDQTEDLFRRDAESYDKSKSDDKGKDKDKDHGKSDDKDKKDKSDKDHGKSDDKDKKDKSDKDHGKSDDKGKDKDKDKPGKDDKDKPGKDKDHDKPGKDKDHDKPGKDKDHDKPGKDKDHDHGKGHDKGHEDGRDGQDGRDGRDGAAAPAAAPLSPALNTLANQVIAQSRRCVSKRVVRIRLDRRYKIRTARVLLNGKLVKVRRTKKGVYATIDLRNRAKGAYTVRSVVVTKGKRIKIGTRVYRTCTAKKRS